MLLCWQLHEIILIRCQPPIKIQPFKNVDVTRSLNRIYGAVAGVRMCVYEQACFITRCRVWDHKYSQSWSQQTRRIRIICKCSQEIVVAVCSRWKKKTICISLFGVHNFTGYRGYKVVLYCDVSDGCCHRLEIIPSFCHPFGFSSKGTTRQKLNYSSNPPLCLYSPRKTTCFEKFAHSAICFVSGFTET